MALATSNRDGGKTSESGHLRALGKTVSGDIITGLNAVQRAAGVNMSVDVQIGDAFVRRSDGSYAHPVFNDAVYNQVISAADGSNPRRDIVVIYVDYGETPSTAVSNNTNGVVKIKVVNGTPAGSPVDPNGAAIQASVGAGNPYSILARVRVPAGQTSISNSLIDDLRTMITANTNSVPTAAIQDNAVSIIRLNVDETTDFASPVNLTSNTWTDFKGNQSFTVNSASSVIEIKVDGGAGVGTAANTTVLSRVVIDSAGTPINKKIGTMQIPTGNTVYPYIKFGSVFLTGLAPGTHTVKTQLFSSGANTAAYCRPVLSPNTEWFNTTVVEHKK